jgi:zinc protease
VPTIDESLARLEKVTVEEVRQLYNEQLGGQHGELVVVGDFEPDAVLGQVDRALKDWKTDVACKRIVQPVPEGIKPERLVIDTPDKKSALYVAGMLLALRDTDSDNPALEMANFVLGGGSLASRLSSRIRDKEGLSYGVQSAYNADAKDKYARFLLLAMCNPKNIDKVDKAMREEVDKMRQDGISQNELAEAKKAYLAALKQLRASDSSLAGIIQSELHAGRRLSVYYGELEKKIAALTVEEVNSAFRNHVDPEKLVIIRAGDFKKQ